MMGKHRKKSKRPRSDEASADAEPADTTLLTEQNHGCLENKQHRTKEAPVASSETPILVDRDDLSQAKKRKKTKTKKPKKKSSKDSKEADLDEKSYHDSVEDIDDSCPLEGCMIDDQMVLIDRTRGVVFSAIERDHIGARKQVGIVKDGKVELTVQETPETSTTDAFTTAAGKDEDEDGVASFPFETDADDHCESPLQAYQDILPFLNCCGAKKSSSSAALKIYDPYYCNGAVRQNLETLGFPNAYNKKEDCYQVWQTPSRYPSFDILVTNPPYSADHIEKLVQHITSSTFGERPWMLLLPQWVHKKDYYINGTAHIQPFYLVPKKRYVYLPPPSFRQAKKSDVHKKSSPFVSMWYVWGGTSAQNERWLALAQKSCSKTCDVARSKSALRDLRRKGPKTK